MPNLGMFFLAYCPPVGNGLVRSVWSQMLAENIMMERVSHMKSQKKMRDKIVYFLV